jgi:nucleoside-diphosphate-sugar epimerase
MNLFAFGLGYTALKFIELHQGRFARICGTIRSPEKGKTLGELGIVPCLFDGENSDPGILDELARADALLISVPPNAGADPVLGRFSRVIEAAPRLRWVGYLSTIGVYGNADGGWVDETSPLEPVNERSRYRVAAEQQWLALESRAPFSVQIFRLAGIYGPGRNALVRVADGTAQRIVKPGQFFNRIHVEDIARVLMASIESARRTAIYNVADDMPGPPQDVVAYAAELLGREPPPEVPFADANLSPMARSFYQDNKRVRNTRIKQDLGVTLRFPTYREGLQALLASGEGVRSR